MEKGRITRAEHNRRLRVLLQFIFQFRYANKTQLLSYAQAVIKLSHPRWLVEHSQEEGYTQAYFDPQFQTKIYYLTEKAKTFIYEQETRLAYYDFDKRYVGVNTFFRQDILIETYLLFNKFFNISLKDFTSRWLLRIGKNRRESSPDALITFPCGLKIAVQIETHRKNLGDCRRLIDWYRYYIFKTATYHALLFIYRDNESYLSLEKRLFFLAPHFAKDAFIFTEPDRLKLGGCFYQGEAKDLIQAVNLFKEAMQKKQA